MTLFLTSCGLSHSPISIGSPSSPSFFCCRTAQLLFPFPDILESIASLLVWVSASFLATLLRPLLPPLCLHRRVEYHPPFPFFRWRIVGVFVCGGQTVSRRLARAFSQFWRICRLKRCVPSPPVWFRLGRSGFLHFDFFNFDRSGCSKCFFLLAPPSCLFFRCVAAFSSFPRNLFPINFFVFTFFWSPFFEDVFSVFQCRGRFLARHLSRVFPETPGVWRRSPSDSGFFFCPFGVGTRVGPFFPLRPSAPAPQVWFFLCRHPGPPSFFPPCTRMRTCFFSPPPTSSLSDASLLMWVTVSMRAGVVFSEAAVLGPIAPFQLDPSPLLSVFRFHLFCWFFPFVFDRPSFF